MFSRAPFILLLCVLFTTTDSTYKCYGGTKHFNAPKDMVEEASAYSKKEFSGCTMCMTVMMDGGDGGGRLAYAGCGDDDCKKGASGCTQTNKRDAHLETCCCIGDYCHSKEDIQEVFHKVNSGCSSFIGIAVIGASVLGLI